MFVKRKSSAGKEELIGLKSVESLLLIVSILALFSDAWGTTGMGSEEKIILHKSSPVMQGQPVTLDDIATFDNMPLSSTENLGSLVVVSLEQLAEKTSGETIKFSDREIARRLRELLSANNITVPSFVIPETVEISFQKDSAARTILCSIIRRGNSF